jgi:hypothetical protein
MSNGFQHKIYNYEVTPPAGVWAKITLELDESEIAAKFPSLLYNQQAPPPAGIWQKISDSLDESVFVSDYSSKLSGLEIPAPASAWNKISASLDEAEFVTDYSSRLSGMEINPPLSAWNKIKNGLTEETTTKEYRRSVPWLRYAAAASIIAFLAWGALQLFNSKSGDPVITKESINPAVNNNEVAKGDQLVLIPDNTVATDAVTAAMDEARNDAALEASKKTYAKLDMNIAKSKVKNAADFYFVPEETYEPGVRGLGNWQPPVTPENIADRYITLMTPDGNIIRISKKLSDMVGCVAGADQDEECLDQLKIWRQKLANPKTTYTPGSFMEILGLVNSLQNK